MDTHPANFLTVKYLKIQFSLNRVRIWILVQHDDFEFCISKRLSLNLFNAFQHGELTVRHKNFLQNLTTHHHQHFCADEFCFSLRNEVKILTKFNTIYRKLFISEIFILYAKSTNLKEPRGCVSRELGKVIGKTLKINFVKNCCIGSAIVLST